MSTPMFIREPIAKAAAVNGAAFTSFSTATFETIVDDVAEATLIEEIAWSANDFSTVAGSLLVSLRDDLNVERMLAAYALSAGTATLFANGRITLSITLPVGWALRVAHNVGTNVLAISALGGIVR